MGVSHRRSVSKETAPPPECDGVDDAPDSRIRLRAIDGLPVEEDDPRHRGRRSLKDPDVSVPTVKAVTHARQRDLASRS